MRLPEITKSGVHQFQGDPSDALKRAGFLGDPKIISERAILRLADLSTGR
jgi:hypothetical protein